MRNLLLGSYMFDFVFVIETFLLSISITSIIVLNVCYHIQLLGDEVYHYSSKLMMKEAKFGGKHLWHQDYG